MKIIYVYDALCGWCYGFSSVMTQFQERHKENYTFEVLSGGMITGSRIGPIGDVASYISTAYKDVENTTGVKFGDEFLSKTLKIGKAIFTSIPPAIALSVFKDTNEQDSILFASKLQKAIYHDGIEPGNFDAYGRIAALFDINAETFVLKMKDPLYKSHAEEDFKKSAELKVSGFPSVFLESSGTYYKIASGYSPLNRLENNLLAIKNVL